MRISDERIVELIAELSHSENVYDVSYNAELVEVLQDLQDAEVEIAELKKRNGDKDTALMLCRIAFDNIINMDGFVKCNTLQDAQAIAKNAIRVTANEQHTSGFVLLNNEAHNVQQAQFATMQRALKKIIHMSMRSQSRWGRKERTSLFEQNIAWWHGRAAAWWEAQLIAESGLSTTALKEEKKE